MQKALIIIRQWELHEQLPAVYLVIDVFREPHRGILKFDIATK